MRCKKCGYSKNCCMCHRDGEIAKISNSAVIPGYKPVYLCEEDILNLRNAEKRIFDTLTRDYEALEIFTIQGIIKQFESSGL